MNIDETLERIDARNWCLKGWAILYAKNELKAINIKVIKSDGSLHLIHSTSQGVHPTFSTLAKSTKKAKIDWTVEVSK